MLNVTNMNVWAIALSSLLFTGCVNQLIKEPNPDLTGKYDGSWMASITMTDLVQRRGQWKFTCPKDHRKAPFTIINGIVNDTTGDVGYVTTDGKLNVRINAGSYNVTSGRGKGRDIVIDAKINGDRAYGKYINAFEGTTIGCQGDFIAKRRKDTEQAPSAEVVKSPPIDFGAIDNSQTTDSNVKQVVAQLKNVKFYDTPSLKGEVVHSVPKGTVINVLKERKKWYLVEASNGLTGWIDKYWVYISTD
jgi:hypothetical protein